MKKFIFALGFLFLLTGCGGGVVADSGGGVVSIGPAITEILVGMGRGHEIIAVDTFSADIYGVAEGVALIDMMSVDVELLLALAPARIFATDMIVIGGVDPLALVAETGVEIFYIPVSESIDAIKRDIIFIAEKTGNPTAGESMVEILEHGITRLRYFINADARTERRTVYFEVYSAPLITVGSGAFLNELLEIVGAENIFADYDGWIVVSDEQILARDPDVILTNSPGVDPVGEIAARPGWHALSAVANGRVFFIDEDSSSRPSHNIIDALWEIARAVYPEYFE